ncbi:DUF4350 domain-containing protein [Novosphingobium album (ex Liu et al. 2023)]|uniref:DUF4350 domain-containing protein n=1 Tax=Novosphingobium album (ex Liu et al. 2023) TaxID=3031130 RepID=A0ABT5WM08_9SPHN|nr:DUF4350 domain-containing protein [Novosphingobium album (ex Liu et al. 2023)]MDE8651083.1 DUF4350 domain-containing protein [Novosphingobium album (ex Liu et al. 2023)]
MNAGARPAGGAIEAGANPFSLRAVLALVVFGALVFLALLWMIATGTGMGSTNDGGEHVEGRGLNGYAALASLLERRGHMVRRSRNEGAFQKNGLLVLTPPLFTSPDAVDKAIAAHRSWGPTLLVLPKWMAVPAKPAQVPGAKPGWVVIGGALSPAWGNDVPALGNLDLKVEKVPASKAGWVGFGRAGRLPDRRGVQTLSSGRIVPIVRDGRGQALAGYLDDGSAFADLSAAAGREPEHENETDYWPVVVVAEPDLLDNFGMADKDRALAALSLVRAATGGEALPIVFDMTLNGHARSANLLTLAFTPPFLAATLCLLLAALAAGWRAFLRFGPARRPDRAIAFGKRALVANSAGLIRRAKRLHLLGGPYADRARERIVQALALPREADPGRTDAAIDKALAARATGAISFSETTARLRKARAPHDLIRAALDLHALERTLIR